MRTRCAAPAAAMGNGSRTTSHEVDCAPNTVRSASMPRRHGMASRALSDSPYSPGLIVELGPLTQSRSST